MQTDCNPEAAPLLEVRSRRPRPVMIRCQKFLAPWSAQRVNLARDEKLNIISPKRPYIFGDLNERREPDLLQALGGSLT